MKQAKEQRKKGSKRTSRRSKIDPYRSLVGQLVDREVAEKAGVTPAAVQAYRRKHGIPAAASGSSATVMASEHFGHRTGSPPALWAAMALEMNSSWGWAARSAAGTSISTSPAPG
mgnify:CR=1 FL=1